MARITNADLLRRIGELERENAELKGQPATSAADSSVAGRESFRSRSWAWTLLATVLIVVGAILAPVAVAASWAKATLTDTDRFVATYAPLVRDPDVRDFVTAQTVQVINEQVDIPALTSDVIDGIKDLGTGPVATKALEALKGPAAQGIQSLIQSKVSEFVASEAFATVWTQALRISHAQLIAAMQNDPDAAVSLGGDGSVGIQLAPIIDEVKKVLLDQGITFADQIPSVNRTIVVAQSDALPTIQLGYGLAIGAGAWLPWVALLLLAAGVIVARRRSVALIWAAVALALTMAVLLIAFAIVRVVAVAAVSPSVLPSGVTGTLLEAVIGAMRDTAVAVLVLALVVAVVGWLSGPFRTPKALRGLASTGARRIRDAAETRGLSTGRVGEWIYAQRVLLRVLVAAMAAAMAAAIVIFIRPLTPGLIIWTLVLAALVLAVLEVLQRPAIVVPVEADDDTPVLVEG